MTTARRMGLAQAAILLAVAVATRAWFYGNPVIHSDEQFYLLVGDRMWDGALPFVDIWDRKPVGLFLLYAAMAGIGRLTGTDGVVAYQLVATMVVTATAWLIARIATRLGGDAPMAAAGGMAAGALYPVWLILLDGAGGQASVFFNLPLAVAGWATVRPDAAGGRGRLFLTGTAVMALLGAAIQIKYTVFVEAAAFGGYWLWRLHRRGTGIAALVATAALWGALGVAPTLAAYVFYAVRGHGDAFLYANFLSILDRRPERGWLGNFGMFAGGVALVAPLALLAWRGRARAWWPVWGWVAVAFAAILAIGTFQTHYFQPLLVPLCVAAAPGLVRAGRFDRRTYGWLLAIALVVAAGMSIARIHRRGTEATIAALTGMIGHRPPGCLFVYGSEPVLYHLTRACLPTRYLFRSHLGQAREQDAIGVDQVGELRRVLATCPGVIVMRDAKRSTSPVTEGLVKQALATGYTRVGAVTIGGLAHTVWRRRADAWCTGVRAGG